MTKEPELKPGTPLPWQVEEGHIQRDSNGIRYWQIHDGHDAIACNQFCYANFDPAVNAANAAYIVTACNAYPTLLARIEALEGERLEWRSAVSDALDYLDGDISHEHESRLRALLNRPSQ